MKVDLNLVSFGNFNVSNDNVCKNKKNKPSFGFNLKHAIDTIPRSAREIERDLFVKYDMNADFRGNDLIANCVERTTRIFFNIFNKDFLPKKVGFKSFNDFGSRYKNSLGLFVSSENFYHPQKEVYINSDCIRHYDETLLNINAKLEQFPIPIIGNFHSSGNVLSTFVHEFAHCAHFTNVLQKGNSFSALDSIPFPQINDRIIDNDKIGKYAFEDKKVVELVAETLTRQILEYPETITIYDRTTLFNYNDVCDSEGVQYLQAAWNGNKRELEDWSKYIDAVSREQNVEDALDTLDHIISGITGF